LNGIESDKFHYFCQKKLQSLRQFIHFLSPIRDQTWEHLTPLFRPRNLIKGEIFIQEGDTARELGFLNKGVIRAYYLHSNGSEYNKHFFVPPCFIGGYASLITGRPNQIIQEALTDCEIFVADYAAFVQSYDEYPELGKVARRLAELFFVAKEQKEIEMATLDADKRYLIFQKEFPGLEQLIPQYQIASYLGITPTQLSRIRRKIAGR
jgi:CRP-like cAMP-binding protein